MPGLLNNHILYFILSLKGVSGNPGEPGLKGDKVIRLFPSYHIDLLITTIQNVTNQKLMSHRAMINS